VNISQPKLRSEKFDDNNNNNNNNNSHSYFHEIWYLEVLLKLVAPFQFLLNLYKNKQMNVTVERKMYFQPTATRFDFTNKPSSVCTEKLLFNKQHVFFNTDAAC